MNATTIVGWAYQADEFHSECLPAAFAGDNSDEVEANIKLEAAKQGIGQDEDDPLLRSTEHLPQPIVSTEADCRYCGECHAGLIEGQ
jgi:hypothetical protein